MRLPTCDRWARYRACGKVLSGVTLVATAAFVGLVPMTSGAANGAWNVNASGNWSTTANWSGGIIANGSGFTADFGGVGISGNRTVTLDSSRTIGHLIFGDTSVSPVHDWSLQQSGGSVLTLQVPSGTPTILVSNGTATISLTLVGNQGLAKAGAGVLLLSATNNYGDTFINAGTLRLGGANRLPRGTALTLANAAGATFDLNANNQIIGSLAGGGSLGGNVTLGSGVLTVGDTNNSSFAGAISGSGNFIKQGIGTLTLSGVNTFGGSITVNNGALRAANNSAFGDTGTGTTVSSGGAVELIGGISVGESLNLTGTGVSNGGGLRNISGNNVWSGAISLPTVTTNRINSDSGTLIINGTISEMASGTKTLVFGGAGNVTVSNNITSSIAVVKDGTGTLALYGNNSYSGSTTVRDGVLALNSANALAGANLTLGGGILGLGTGNFTRALGTANNQVQFSTDGGFAAYVTNRNVNLGGASAGVTWNSGSFVPSGSALILGAANQTHTLTFQNPINFNGALRTVQVNKGLSAVDAVLSGQLSGTGASGLIKSGTGRLSLTASNTYAGGTLINSGILSINNVTGSGTGSGAVTVNNGGTLGGNGFISGIITNRAGGTIAAGNSVGLLTTGAELWEGGSIIGFEINDVDAGAGAGWDLIASSGTLSIDATSANKIEIDVLSLALDNNPGIVHDFDLSSGYIWTLATAVGGISFKPGESESTVFNIVANQFLNPLDGTFHFALGNGGNDLDLVYSPNAVPEPSVVGVFLFGLAGLMFVHRMRRFSV